MQDGHTRKLEPGVAAQALFLARHRISLVVIGGDASGQEYELDSEQVTLGRGPGATFTFADGAMSKQHAALDLGGEGYRVRDLGSTNGLMVNGSEVSAADLKHGDKLVLGEHTLQYLVESRESVRTYELSQDD